MKNQNFDNNNSLFVSTDKFTQGPAKSIEVLGKREKKVHKKIKRIVTGFSFLGINKKKKNIRDGNGFG